MTTGTLQCHAIAGPRIAMTFEALADIRQHQNATFAGCARLVAREARIVARQILLHCMQAMIEVRIGEVVTDEPHRLHLVTLLDIR